MASVRSLLAVEAALRERYDATRTPLQRLLARARTDGLIDEEWAERLDAGRRLRNSLAHSRVQAAWTPGMAAGVIRVNHEAVARLFLEPHRHRPDPLGQPSNASTNPA